MNAPKERIDVLVVDDEQSMREFLEVVIDNEGLSVCTVGSGEEAVAIVKEQAARAGFRLECYEPFGPPAP